MWATPLPQKFRCVSYCEPSLKINAFKITHLFDHNTAEVAMLKWCECRVILGHCIGQFHVHLVELIHFLQRQLSLGCPVCWNISKEE